MNLPKVAEYFFISTLDPSKTLQECRIKTAQEIVVESNSRIGTTGDSLLSTPGGLSDLKLEDEFWTSFLSSAESDLSALSIKPTPNNKPNSNRYLAVQTNQVRAYCFVYSKFIYQE